MIRSIILVLASFVLATSCYECQNGTTVINPPSDLTQPTYFPSGWTEDQPLPQMDSDQSCFLNVNVPSGYYASVTFHKHMDLPGGYVYYSNRKISILENDDFNPFFFTKPYFKVSVGTNTSPGLSGFAFKIVWIPIPDVQRKVIEVTKGQPPVAVSPSTDFITFRGDSSSMLSLIGFSLKDPSTNYLLRQTALFGGDTFDDDYIGTLDQIVNSQQILTTYGSKISVYTFGLNTLIDYPLFMAQNNLDAKGYYIYKGVNCPSTGNCSVLLNGNYGNSLTVTDFNGSEYIKEFNTFPDTATINVYENSVSSTTRIASLTVDNYQQQLPLEVKGTMKFYELVGYGKYEMVVTRDVSRAARL
ncbi:hypothetical protein CRE_10141 [Caenorhabditis remanei]|uniref:Uncharacterized protein n=1 Tax=Caenorhabditis remanei TaxID=31234 RepID=E3M6G6_CAERE|nr:hypothetical protein CRE_10141 [Caenorhabditis remanei]